MINFKNIQKDLDSCGGAVYKPNGGKQSEELQEILDHTFTCDVSVRVDNNDIVIFRNDDF